MKGREIRDITKDRETRDITKDREISKSKGTRDIRKDRETGNIGKDRRIEMNIILTRMRENGKKFQAESENSKNRRAIVVESGNVRLPEELREIRDIAYETEDGGTLMADIVMPKEPSGGPLPVVVMIHGGALLFGNRRSNLPFRYNLSKLGYIVYSLEYRMIDETDFFGEVSDVCGGLRLAAKTAEEYNGDPGRISLIGESAGGLLALYAAAMTRSEILRRQIGCQCPDIRVHSLILNGGMLYTSRFDYIAAVYKKDLYRERRKDRDFMQYINPEHPEVVSHLPKVCLTSASGDFLRKSTLRYAKALKKAGHPTLLIYYPEGKNLPHAFVSLCPSLKESRDALKRIDQFISS